MNTKKWISGFLTLGLAGCGINAFLWKTDIGNTQLSAVLPDGKVLAWVKTGPDSSEVKLIGIDGTVEESAESSAALPLSVEGLHVVGRSQGQLLWLDQTIGTIYRVSESDLTATVTTTLTLPTPYSYVSPSSQSLPLTDGGTILLRKLMQSNTLGDSVATALNPHVQLVRISADGTMEQSQILEDITPIELLHVEDERIDLVRNPGDGTSPAVIHLNWNLQETSRLSLPTGTQRTLEDHAGRFWVRIKSETGTEWQILAADGTLVGTAALNCDGADYKFTKENHLIMAAHSNTYGGNGSACLAHLDADGHAIFEKTFPLKGVVTGSAPYLDDQGDVALLVRSGSYATWVGSVNGCSIYETSTLLKAYFLDAAGTQQTSASFPAYRFRESTGAINQVLCNQSETTGVFDVTDAKLLGHGRMIAIADQRGPSSVDYATLIQTVKP